MEISEAKQDDVSIVDVKGRLDAASCGALEQKLLGMIAAGDRHLVLDLSQLDYVSSAGLRVLLVVTKKLSAASGKLGLAGLKDHIQEIFDLSGFTDIFALYPSRAEAVAGVK